MISGLLLFLWFVLNTLLLGAVTRRLLGVPVGWPRTIVVSAIVLVTGGAPAREISRNLGFLTEGGQVVEGNELVVGAVTFVVLLWIIAAGLAMLVILEAIVPTGSLPGPLTLVRGLPARRRRQRGTPRSSGWRCATDWAGSWAAVRAAGWATTPRGSPARCARRSPTPVSRSSSSARCSPPALT